MIILKQCLASFFNHHSVIVLQLAIASLKSVNNIVFILNQIREIDIYTYLYIMHNFNEHLCLYHEEHYQKSINW